MSILTANKIWRSIATVSICLLTACAISHVTPPAPNATAATPETLDDTQKNQVPTVDFDYEKRDVMIPMRDGVKLFTVIVIPKGAKNAPILFTRNPYNAAGAQSFIELPVVAPK